MNERQFEILITMLIALFFRVSAIAMSESASFYVITSWVMLSVVCIKMAYPEWKKRHDEFMNTEWKEFKESKRNT